MNENEVLEMEELTGELVAGQMGIVDTIFDKVSNNIVLATCFVNSLRSLLKERNTIDLETLKLLDGMYQSLLTAMVNTDNKEDKAFFQKTFYEIVHLIKKTTSEQRKNSLITTCATIAGGVAVASLVSFAILKSNDLKDNVDDL